MSNTVTERRQILRGDVTWWVRNFDGKDSGDVDASIVATQMMLQAADLGIGTCWIGHFDPLRIKALLNIPDHIVPVAMWGHRKVAPFYVPWCLKLFYADRKAKTGMLIAGSDCVDEVSMEAFLPVKF